MIKYYFFLILSLIFFEKTSIFAQTSKWILPLQKEWQYKNGAFVNTKNEVAVYSFEKNAFENVKITAKNTQANLKDSVLQFYDNGYNLGNIAYQVSKYGMTAIIDKQNRIIVPYSKNISSATVFQDTLLKINEFRHEYIYNKDGKMLQFMPNKGDAKVGVYRVRYQEYFLFDYEKKKILSELYSELDDIHNMKTTFIAIKNNLYGVLNEKNEAVLPFEFQSCQYAADSLLLVKKQNQYAIIQLNGKEILPYGSAQISAYRNSLFLRKTIDEKSDVFLMNGQKLGNVSFKKVTKTDDGVIFCARNYDDGVIYDSSGKLINQDTLVEIDYLDNVILNKNAHYAKKKSGWGIQRKDGTWLVPPFSSNKEFVGADYIKINKKDIAKYNIPSVKTCETCPETDYYFDLNFNLLYPYPCKLQRYGSYKDTLQIYTNGKTSLINTKGKLLFPLNYSMVSVQNDGCFLMLGLPYFDVFGKNFEQITFQKDSVVNQYAYSENAHTVRTKSGKTGLQKNDGKWILKPVLCNDLSVYNNIINIDKKSIKSLITNELDTCTTCKEKYYLLSLDKKLLCKTPAEITYYGHNFYVYRSNGLYGVLDKNFNEIVALKYTNIQYINTKTVIIHDKNDVGILTIE